MLEGVSMVGQNQLRELFTEFINGEKSLPRSILLIGAMGSGRRTFAKWLTESMNIPLITVGASVDEVREITGLCYKLVEQTYYVIPNVEQMSGAAQNALLKILEEPPNNAGFILTTTQENLILPTIKSRCVTYYMNVYSEKELNEYAHEKYAVSTEMQNILHNVCVCPGDVDILFSHDITNFNNYVNKVYDNIAVVSGANSFKISGEINLSDDTDKYDLTLFWRAFISRCITDFMGNADKCASGVRVTTKYLQDLRVKGLNKQIAFDNWILDIRKEWLQYADS